MGCGLYISYVLGLAFNSKLMHIMSVVALKSSAKLRCFSIFCYENDQPEIIAPINDLAIQTIDDDDDDEADKFDQSKINIELDVVDDRKMDQLRGDQNDQNEDELVIERLRESDRSEHNGDDDQNGDGVDVDRLALLSRLFFNFILFWLISLFLLFILFRIFVHFCTLFVLIRRLLWTNKIIIVKIINHIIIIHIHIHIHIHIIIVIVIIIIMHFFMILCNYIWFL